MGGRARGCGRPRAGAADHRVVARRLRAGQHEQRQRAGGRSHARLRAVRLHGGVRPRVPALHERPRGQVRLRAPAPGGLRERADAGGRAGGARGGGPRPAGRGGAAGERPRGVRGRVRGAVARGPPAQARAVAGPPRRGRPVRPPVDAHAALARGLHDGLSPAGGRGRRFQRRGRRRGAARAGAGLRRRGGRRERRDRDRRRGRRRRRQRRAGGRRRRRRAGRPPVRRTAALVAHVDARLPARRRSRRASEPRGGDAAGQPQVHPAQLDGDAGVRPGRGGRLLAGRRAFGAAGAPVRRRHLGAGGALLPPDARLGVREGRRGLPFLIELSRGSRPRWGGGPPSRA
mmetsp:Transcript_12754/g.53633  ORF Transcript_12754/g.53633 Transcript_12754/m.53633 type:complete len:345 (-) Transcript_12754:331-1365(-)